MADSTFPASDTTEHGGVHPSRALMVIPQPPRRSVWRAAAAAAVRALVLPFLLPVFAVRALFVLVRGTVRAAGGGVRGLGHAAWLAVRGLFHAAWIAVRGLGRGASFAVLGFGRAVRAAARGAGLAGYGLVRLAGRGAWLALRGAGVFGLGLVRLVGRGAVALNAGVEAGVHGIVTGVVWTARSTVRLAAATTTVVAYLVAGLVAITANVSRTVGVALLAVFAAASYGFIQALRVLGLALLGLGRGVVAAVVAVASAVAAVARAVAGAVRGVFVALRAAVRLIAPARPGAAVAVAAVAYALLAGVEHFVPFLGHVLVATPAAVVVLAFVGFVAAALYNHASRTVALGVLALLCIGGVRIGADVAAQGAWGAAAAAAVFALLAGRAAWRFGRAFALPVAVRSPSIERAHRDAGVGLAGVLLGQLAVCGVWLAGLDAVERTASLVIDLASAQLVLIAIGGWLAVSVARGRHLRGAQITLVGALLVVLVLGVASSLQAIGHRHGATAVSIALGGLLALAATALCLVVRARIADGSYAPLASGSGAAA